MSVWFVIKIEQVTHPIWERLGHKLVFKAGIGNVIEFKGDIFDPTSICSTIPPELVERLTYRGKVEGRGLAEGLYSIPKDLGTVSLSNRMPSGRDVSTFDLN